MATKTRSCRRSIARAVPVLGALLLGPSAPAPACGPYALLTYFWAPVGLDLPLDQLVNGELTPFDNLRPREAYTVFRQLTERPLSAPDRAAVVGRATGEQAEPEGDPRRRWLALRAEVADRASAGRPAAYRWGPGYRAYPNCLRDAFAVAARALASRIARWGRSSREVGEWLAGQDQVFANCGGGEHLPSPLDASWPEDLRFDRDYQIAAALFYAERWQEAEQRFLAIAAQPRSPWSMISAYVAARAMLRQDRFADAAEQLRSVLAEPRLEPRHADADRLLRYARYRVEPAAMHAETRALLLASELPEDFDQRFADYRWGLDTVPDLDHDLDLWMLASRRRSSGYPGARAASAQLATNVIERWRDRGGRLWRLAAVTVLDPHAVPAATVDAVLVETALADTVLADTVRADTEGVDHGASLPEAGAVGYHRARLLLARGRFEAADAELARLRPLAAGWTVGARNRVRELEARAAPDLRGLFAGAVAEPASLSWSGEFPASFEQAGIDRHDTALLDLAVTVAQRLPAGVLAELADPSAVSPRIARRMLVAAFARALILGDHDLASRLAPRVEREVAWLAGGARAYRHALPGDRGFVAALVLLWAPGARPWLDFGIAEDATTPWGSWGWWCGGPWEAPERDPLPPMRAEVPTSPSELAALRTLAPAPEHLAAQVLPWAETHPDDPRLPEALHRLVVTTRRACGERFGTVSKRAFDLLHRRYPASPWTAKTPYWYGS